MGEEFGVAKSVVLRILGESRVVVRRQPIAAEQVSEAADLYESGLPLSQIATRLDVNQGKMRVAILKAGVTLREPTKAKSA